MNLILALHPFHEGHPIFFSAGHPAAAGHDAGATVAALGYMLAGALLMWLGRAVRRGAGSHFFGGSVNGAGPEPSKMADWAGGRITGLAMLTLATSALLMMFPEQAGALVAFFLLGMIGGTLALIRGTHRHRA